MSQGKVPFVWSNDDLSVERAENLLRMLDFLKRYGIPASFATIPIRLTKDGPRYLHQDAALRDAMARAHAEGHEFFQHGTRHVCREFGLGDPRMYHGKLMGYTESRDITRRRQYYERFWTLEAITAQLAWGREVWIDTFGSPPAGFRPGCGCRHRNLFPALEDLGFAWVSSDMVSYTGWMWTVGELDYPDEYDPPVRPYRLSAKLIEFPVLDDFCFRTTPELMDRFVALGLRYWQRCVENGDPYILVSHWHGLEYSEGTGYKVHERLLDTILGSGKAHPMTLGQYHVKLLSGEYPMAPAETLCPAETPEWHVWRAKQ